MAGFREWSGHLPGEPDEVAGWLPPDWAMDRPECARLMTADLRAERPVPPAAYRLGLEVVDRMVFAVMADEAGERAACGPMALGDGVAVSDQAATEPAHRSRGWVRW